MHGCGRVHGSQLPDLLEQRTRLRVPVVQPRLLGGQLRPGEWRDVAQWLLHKSPKNTSWLLGGASQHCTAKPPGAGCARRHEPHWAHSQPIQHACTSIRRAPAASLPAVLYPDLPELQQRLLLQLVLSWLPSQQRQLRSGRMADCMLGWPAGAFLVARAKADGTADKADLPRGHFCASSWSASSWAGCGCRALLPVVQCTTPSCRRHVCCSVRSLTVRATSPAMPALAAHAQQATGSTAPPASRQAVVQRCQGLTSLC